ncbi:MAG: histone deacetylase [Acidobacteriaceae bacterium]|nr:histone deacetylase [Acidobacteriaceae bacterium]
MSRTGIATDSRVKEHDPGPGHPESPARYTALLAGLEKAGLLSDLKKIEVREASEEDLLLVHTPQYLALVEREVAQNRTQLSTGDTAISLHSDAIAKIASGCALAAVDAVLTGSVRNAFCAVRPPGHHASATRGMGFCLYNTVALAARYAQKKHGLGRILIVDWDVHHGNGTQDIFYSDGSVLFFSTHQSPWYPGTGPASERGEGKGAGKTINCPFPAGSGPSEIVGAFRNILLPAAADFHPDLVLISAGFDSRLGDPLGQFTLGDDDFLELTHMMTDLADRYSNGRLVSVLEGGYSLYGLATAACAHIQALLGH